MKVNIITPSPQALKYAIFKNVEDEEFRTWEIVTNNNQVKFLNHTSAQYTNKVLIGLTVTQGVLTAEVNWWTNMGEPDDAVKAVIIGNFTALLLTYYRADFIYLETHG